MRLIDADELIKVIQKRWGGVPLLCTKTIDQADIIISDIDVQPTVGLWHYPAKGEYPTDDRRVLCIVDGEPYIAEYHSVSGNWYSDKMSCSSAFIDCWQYVEPPKEEA